MTWLSVFFHTHLAIALLVLFFDGVERVLNKEEKIIRWEDIR